MPDTKNRRPLTSRDTGWARGITRWLAGTGITPNQISAASVGFAAFAGACFAGVALTEGLGRVALLIGGGLGVQLRLLCNLFDGMVAVEAGQGGPTGPFWNEVPDRPADILILVGVGIGAGVAWLGWAAAALAVLIAYLRAFGASLGQDADYTGPMAKQHRMAAVTAAAVAGAFLGVWIDAPLVLRIALWVIVAGEIATAARRALRIRTKLAQPD
ncbi:CDP-alcohol phosphatidyltransferase family protein [Jannaschia donghaensis]|uniref:CDP-alcohol phosphatidyltransferase n=1 Tax=Jannaschia donghaensis TaxID=420998 RepID=A0A0M6YFX6_9RHOB|nr:CDP-alcohol phosphatidyltransferase family protein [Jannaschia donghaensis]CTQ49258.1 CDP-alcohol phosphatidyltransferase [Jannaschia donghaensis]